MIIAIGERLPVRTAILAPPPVANVLAPPSVLHWLPARGITFIPTAPRAPFAGGIAIITAVVIGLRLAAAIVGVSAGILRQ